MALGQRYGRLVVFGFAEVRSQNSWWHFACDCGAKVTKPAADVRSGRTQSCGCKNREHARTALKARNTIHGMEKTPEYRTWVDIRRRCHDPDRPDYHRYGGRGISVCDEWRFGDGALTGFECFLRDMGRRPDGHTLDRKDNDGPYSKANCRWATRQQQGRNTRTNRFIEVRGERMTLVEASERFGIDARTLKSRLDQRGWDAERAVTTPVR